MDVKQIRISSFMKPNFLLSILLLIAGKNYSQSFSVSGKVTTESDTPVYNAVVTFTNENDTTKTFSALTDTSGNYSISLITGIEEAQPLPKSIELSQNYPNPFSSATTISYKLNEQSNITIKIYDILGREVRTFREGVKASGVYGIKWDGRSNSGAKVSPGVYICQLQSGKERHAKKMMLMEGVAEIEIPVTGKFSSLEEAKQGDTFESTDSEYTIEITSSNKTEPLIKSYEVNNIIIRSDTTMNFGVEKSLWRFLGLGNEDVSAIAVDPGNSDIIYVGTTYNYSLGINGKLFKSTDGGTTWDTLLTGGGYREILIDPLNTNIIYAVPGVLIKSEDGGENWEYIMDGIDLALETRVQCLAMNPLNSQVLYAGTAGLDKGGLYKSYDGGLHWNEIGADSLVDGVISIAIDAGDTNNVYAGTSWRCILWKSVDAGMNWFQTELMGRAIIFDIFIDPAEPSTIYAGTEGIFKSEDYGVHWNNIWEELPELNRVYKVQGYNSSRLFIIITYDRKGGIYDYSFSENKWSRMGVDTIDLEYYDGYMIISSNPDRLYIGGEGGIYVMDLE